MAASTFTTTTRFASARDEPKSGAERDTDYGEKMPRFDGNNNSQKPGDDDDGTRDTDYGG